MKEKIRTLTRRYAGKPMDVQQEEIENDFLDSIMELVGIEMASELGKLGGQVKSEAKAKAVRENGKKGGRPKTNKMVAGIRG
jgi:hypothetical protein